MRVPRPLHVGQAPCGALNENICGDSSGNEIPQCVQVFSSLISHSSGGGGWVLGVGCWSCVLPAPVGWMLITIMPSPARSACSMLSVRRVTNASHSLCSPSWALPFVDEGRTTRDEGVLLARTPSLFVFRLSS